MRNLKKVLALVLAMVMAFSLMSVSSAAFADQASVSDTYDVAVRVLNGLQVFKGKTETTFNPKDDITRAEVAAIIYRLVTGDVEDTYASIYSDYAQFPDVKAKGSGYWASGYIGYCVNATYIKGDNGKFRPDDSVTGYEALAMILRAVGYDKAGEFTGSNWSINVASTSRELGILEGVSEGQLVLAASRELVAYLLFNAATQAPTVTYTSALGYNQYKTTLVDVNSEKNDTLAWKTFKLADEADSDEWGRPGNRWFKDGSPYDKKWNKADDSSVIFIGDTPDASYTDAVTECKIAEDVGLSKDTTFTLYTNGNVEQEIKDGNCGGTHTPGVSKSSANITSYVVQPLDTVQTLGATGTLTEVYKDAGVIVSIDTFLAKVVAKRDATYDAAGHLKDPSRLTLAVYTSVSKDAGATTTDDVKAEYVYVTNGKTNYDEYAKGDMVLINAYTHNDSTTTGAGTTGGVVVESIMVAKTTNTNVNDATAAKKFVYGTDNVTDSTKVTADAAKNTAHDYDDATGDEATNVDIAKAYNVELLGKAETVTGAQTIIWTNAAKHTVSGTDYADSKWFKLDQAEKKVTNHTWYLDSYGNVIGATTIATTYSYGVIEAIQWINPQMDGGYAMATIRYMDGTVAENQKISTIDLFGMVAGTVQDGNAGGAGNTSDGTNNIKTGYASLAANVAYVTGAAKTISTTLGENAIYFGADLFRIETNANGSLSLQHVTDKKLTKESVAHLDDGGAAAGVKVDSSKPYIAYPTGKYVYVNDNTQYLVRVADPTTLTGWNYKTYTGYENVPDYTKANDIIVDYAYLDSDAYADIVYITGTADNSVGVQLLYVTSTSYKTVPMANNTNKVDHYVISGYLDGVYTDEILVGSNDRTGDTKYATATTFLGNLAKNVMFEVKFTDGLITAVTAPDAGVSTAADNPITSAKNNKTGKHDLDDGDGDKPYYGTNMDVRHLNQLAGVTYKDGVLDIKVAGDQTDLLVVPADLTPVVGTLTEDLSDKEVYVVYDTTKQIVTALYIAEPADTADKSGETNPTSYKVTLDLKLTTGNVYNGKGALMADDDPFTYNADGTITFTVVTGTAAPLLTPSAPTKCTITQVSSNTATGTYVYQISDISDDIDLTVKN